MKRKVKRERLNTPPPTKIKRERLPPCKAEHDLAAPRFIALMQEIASRSKVRRRRASRHLATVMSIAAQREE